ncbi:MAG TPA: C39 family peptidase [Phycisphaerae bacterium]|nr:C39 family peptidase [Phycisphaerae bacterium]
MRFMTVAICVLALGLSPCVSPVLAQLKADRAIMPREPWDAQSKCLPTGPPPAAGYQPYEEALNTRGQKVIAGVPGYLWRHGCGPTAAGMVIGYWDAHGFPALIPGDASTQTDPVDQAIASGNGAGTHYIDYSVPIDDEGTGILPDRSEPPAGDEHPNDCLGDWMRTSWSAATNYYGWSWFSDVAGAFVGYVNYVNGTYCAAYKCIAWSETYGGSLWDNVVAQIDADYPVVFLVDSSGDGTTDHFVTVVGYRDTSGFNEYGCLDTWAPAGDVRWERFQGIATGVPWGIHGAIYFLITGTCDDTTPPTITDSASSGNVGPSCEYLVTFSTTITDDCCIDAGDVDVTVSLLSGNATLGTPTINIMQTGVDEVWVLGSVLVSDLTSCPARIQVHTHAVDCCGNEANSDVVAEVDDATPPTITCNAVGGNVDENCEYLMPFSATVLDNCCVNAADVDVLVELLTGNATLGTPTINKVQVEQGEVQVDGTVLVSDLTSCPATVRVTVNADDCCSNAATTCVATADVNDVIPPELTCPPDITLERGDKICNTDVQDWLDSATATDNCDTNVDIVDDSAANGFACGFPYGSSTLVTWTATDDCGNTDECSATITIKPAPRVTSTGKGSVLIFPKVELRWNAAGEFIQDTFIDLTNDWSEAVYVQLYFYNGDPELPAEGPERAHTGCNWVDNAILLTGNEPAYWSALTGGPKGVSPFTVLDPSTDPLQQGRPAQDGTTDRVLRGMVVAWAVNANGAEIRWNHLKGDALILNYAAPAAWEYNAWAFSARCLEQGEEPLDCIAFDANGVCCDAVVIPGQLDFDAFQYDFAFDKLVLDFFASGQATLAGVAGIDTDLTLVPVDLDLRQETAGPVTTKAKFDIWNANEVKFSNTERCITCWDQQLVSRYAVPNHFLRENLQTTNGRARIDGLMSTRCPDSVATPLLGLAMRLLTFPVAGEVEMAGGNLVGMGYQSGQLLYDVLSPPPELWPKAPGPQPVPDSPAQLPAAAVTPQ